MIDTTFPITHIKQHQHTYTLTAIAIDVWQYVVVNQVIHIQVFKLCQQLYWRCEAVQIIIWRIGTVCIGIGIVIIKIILKIFLELLLLWIILLIIIYLFLILL